ncbi:hypothetical protein HPB47_006270 [Ixodes persulcatus]|uniref:Uncharacterized protein n=1 Tax=Ixodes persulcatus TaxID=34615 RepID=A0AC60PAN4_IXOPE|nr:hypothetical protein HPB47_006270 [Ixodes persulcatus]
MNVSRFFLCRNGIVAGRLAFRLALPVHGRERRHAAFPVPSANNPWEPSAPCTHVRNPRCADGRHKRTESIGRERFPGNGSLHDRENVFEGAPRRSPAVWDVRRDVGGRRRTHERDDPSLRHIAVPDGTCGCGSSTVFPPRGTAVREGHRRPLRLPLCSAMDAFLGNGGQLRRRSTVLALPLSMPRGYANTS